jgi:hypothetical protein
MQGMIVAAKAVLVKKVKKKSLLLGGYQELRELRICIHRETGEI